MRKTVEYFEKKARLEHEDEAKLIRERLELLMNNILTELKKQDKRFQGTLIESGSVYEGVKVGRPDEFDFMIRIDSLTDKLLFRECDKGKGYTKLILQEQGWEEFIDDEGFFNPNLLSRCFNKLVNGALKKAAAGPELPEGVVIQPETQENWNKMWWSAFSMVLAKSDEQESSGAIYSTETHGPATTFKIEWQGGDRYRGLKVSLDLTLALEFQSTKLPAQLSKLAQIDPVLQKCGFHVVPAGFDSWRISFSLAEKEILASSPDGFKACYRVLKAVRDDISERLGWNPSLIPSYMLKTILLSELFKTDRHLTWEKEDWSKRIVQVLELALKGVEVEKIPSFFIPAHNLLTVSDHDNKLRQFVLEDMLNQVKGLDLVYAGEIEDAKEIKQEILVLKMIDLLDFIISSLLAGKNSTVVMKRMFVNIANFPVSKKTRWFWASFTNFDTELDERAYNRLAEIWRWVEVFFTRVLATLEGESRSLAQGIYTRTRQRFESANKGRLEQQGKSIAMSPCALLFEWLESAVDFYFKEENSKLPNLRKAAPSELTKLSLFPDVADVAWKKGSAKGRKVLKKRLRKYILMVKEDDIINTVAEYFSQMLLYSKEVWKQKFDAPAVSPN